MKFKEGLLFVLSDTRLMVCITILIGLIGFNLNGCSDVEKPRLKNIAESQSTRDTLIVAFIDGSRTDTLSANRFNIYQIGGQGSFDAHTIYEIDMFNGDRVGTAFYPMDKVTLRHIKHKR